MRLKFQDPDTTAKGETRATVPLQQLDTLWLNTGTLCNLACANCYIESSPQNDRLVYLTRDEARSFLDAELLWMPPGSFWTEPKGEAHITAAQGPSNVAYVEIESGPYLVAPPTEAFRTGEYPINLHTSNIQWLDQTASPWVRGAEIAFLWGEPRPRALNGTFLRLFAGTAGALEFRGSGDGLLVSGTAQLGGHALKPGDGVSV
ncbi:MAG: DUF4437 domain-containing protein, partial [Myxococcota bacterium]